MYTFYLCYLSMQERFACLGGKLAGQSFEVNSIDYIYKCKAKCTNKLGKLKIHFQYNNRFSAFWPRSSVKVDYNLRVFILYNLIKQFKNMGR